MTQVYLGLGANLGEVFQTFLLVQKELTQLLKSPLQASSIYKSEPFTGLDQPTYFNMVIGFQTQFTALELFTLLQKVELTFGRVRGKERWTNRLIDIDIISFGNQVIEDETLTIPHYDLERRDFVLIPLKEIAPNFTHPITKTKISDMIEAIPKELKTSLVIASHD